MSYDIVELIDEDRTAIRNHLLRLSPTDRRLRFFSTIADSGIERYAFEFLNLITGKAFGAIDRNGRLVAMACASEVKTSNGRISCEVAFSIDEEDRSRGLVKRLMEVVLLHCTQHGVEKLCMSCLRENRKMQAVALSFGLKMKFDFDEAYADLILKE